MGTESEGLRPTSVMIVDDQRYARLGLALMIRKAPDLRVVGEAVTDRRRWRPWSG